MKKTIVLLLLTLLLTVCGCGEEDIRGNYEGGNQTKSSTSTTTTSTVDSNATDTSSTSDNPTTTTTTTPSTTSPGFSMGNASATAYVSDFIGIRYQLDDGWFFYDDAQIKQLNNLTADLAGDEMKEILENASVVYDMYATNSNATDNVLVTLEKVNPLQLLTLDVVENFKASIPVIKTSFQNMGYQNISCQVVKVVVDGVTLDALRTTAEIGDVTMHQIAFAKKCNGYLASVAITTVGGDTTADLLDNFEWID